MGTTACFVCVPLNVQATLNCFRALKAACTFSGSLKGDAHPASGLRSFEQKPRACVPHASYVWIGGFMRATACCTFSSSPRGAWAAIGHPTSGLRSFEQKLSDRYGGWAISTKELIQNSPIRQ